ncbi:MAG TPA: hypothetical protein VM054_07160 [bacterium]|nr:hypothetical protein [bacterium]
MDKNDFSISLDIIAVEILLKCVLDDIQKMDVYKASLVKKVFERVNDKIEFLTGDVENIIKDTSFAKLKKFVFELLEGYPNQELIGYWQIDYIFDGLNYDELKKDGIID